MLNWVLRCQESHTEYNTKVHDSLKCQVVNAISVVICCKTYHSCRATHSGCGIILCLGLNPGYSSDTDWITSYPVHDIQYQAQYSVMVLDRTAVTTLSPSRTSTAASTLALGYIPATHQTRTTLPAGSVAILLSVAS